MPLFQLGLTQLATVWPLRFFYCSSDFNITDSNCACRYCGNIPLQRLYLGVIVVLNAESETLSFDVQGRYGGRRDAGYGVSSEQWWPVWSRAVKALGVSLGVWWPNARSSGFARLAFSGRLSSFAALPNDGASKRLRWVE